MYASLADAQRAVEKLPQIAGCTLVDWRNCEPLEEGEPCGTCCRCRKDLQESEIIYKIVTSTSKTNKVTEDAYCSTCYQWDSDEERRKAVDRVVSMLTMMAEHDDVLVARKQMKKQLYLRYSGICTTHKHADLWIDEAIKINLVPPFKKEGQRKKLICLATNSELVHTGTAGMPPSDDLDTSKEEEHVLEFIRQSKSWVSRKYVNESLANAFSRMNTPFMRAKVFLNGHSQRRFFIARGFFGQTVGLTEQEAQESLEMVNKAIKEDLEWNLEWDCSQSRSEEDEEREIVLAANNVVTKNNDTDDIDPQQVTSAPDGIV